jgi:hypothetical protein
VAGRRILPPRLIMQKLNGSGLRRADWPLLLEVYLERHRDTSFAWGVHDCATFALGWLDAVREDLSPQLDALRESMAYTTASGALGRLGERTLRDAVEDWQQLTPVAVNFAQRGDLVLVDLDGRHSLALVVGDGQAAGPGTAGLEFVPMTAARAAWRV